MKTVIMSYTAINAAFNVTLETADTKAYAKLSFILFLCHKFRGNPIFAPRF